ncbi:MAG: carboxypeptidase-like regulatory domain-containing protein, partial [Bryobacteraceae bacterium]
MQNLRSQAAVLTAVVLVGLTAQLSAQFTQSSILGAVRDSTGAAVPNAQVTVRNEGTNLTREIQTGESGDYRVAGLEAGSYRVVVTAPGFKTFEQTRIDVTSNQAKRVDVALELGEVSTTVTVEGGLAQIETESASLSNLKTARDFGQLPLSTMGRGWANIT